MVWLLLFEPRRWMKLLGVFALVAVIVQGVLGGTRVTADFDLPGGRPRLHRPGVLRPDGRAVRAHRTRLARRDAVPARHSPASARGTDLAGPGLRSDRAGRLAPALRDARRAGRSWPGRRRGAARFTRPVPGRVERYRRDVPALVSLGPLPGGRSRHPGGARDHRPDLLAPALAESPARSNSTRPLSAPGIRPMRPSCLASSCRARPPRLSATCGAALCGRDFDQPLTTASGKRSTPTSLEVVA